MKTMITFIWGQSNEVNTKYFVTLRRYLQLFGHKEKKKI